MKHSLPNHLQTSGENHRFRLTPNKMEYMEIETGHRAAFERIALDVFIDVSNAAFSFREALLAVYLTGLQHGVAALNETSH